MFRYRLDTHLVIATSLQNSFVIEHKEVELNIYWQANTTKLMLKMQQLSRKALGSRVIARKLLELTNWRVNKTVFIAQTKKTFNYRIIWLITCLIALYIQSVDSPSRKPTTPIFFI